MFRLPLLIMSLCLLASFAHAQDDDSALLDSTEAPVKRVVHRKVKRRKPIDGETRRVRTKKMVGHRKSFFWYASAGYAMGGDMSYSSVHESTVLTTPRTETAKLSLDPAFELSGGFLNMPQNGWGYGAALSYQMARKVKSLSVDGVSFSTGGGTVQFILIEGSGIYRFRNIFIPFGINYSHPTYGGGSFVLGTSTKAKGDIGEQVGVGYILTPNLYVEGDVKRIGLQMQTDNATDTYTLKTAYLNSFGVKVGYLF